MKEIDLTYDELVFLYKEYLCNYLTTAHGTKVFKQPIYRTCYK